MKKTIIFFCFVTVMLIGISSGRAWAFPPEKVYSAWGSLSCFSEPNYNGAGKEISAHEMKVEAYKSDGGHLWFYGRVGGGRYWVPVSETSYPSPEVKKAADISARLSKTVEKFNGEGLDSSWMRCPDVTLPGKGSYSTWTHSGAIVQRGWYCAFRTNKLCAEFLGVEPIGLSIAELEKLMGASGGWNAPDLAVYGVPNTASDSLFFKFSPSGAVTEAGWMRDAPSDADGTWPGWRLWNLRVYRGDIPEGWPKRAECTGANVNIRKRPGTLSPVVGKIEFKNYPLSSYNSVKRGNQLWTLVDGGIGLRGWMFGKYVKERASARKERFANAFDRVFTLHEVYLANELGETKPLRTVKSKEGKGGYNTVATTWKRSRRTTLEGKFDAFIADVSVTAPGIDLCGMQVGDKILNGAEKREPYFEQFVSDLESCGWKSAENMKWLKGQNYFIVRMDSSGRAIASMSWGSSE